jgi:AcrR family transcriptional regulator
MSVEKTLDVAMSAYWQSDPADVSVNTVCQMAGISKPSLYREFGSEDGLKRAVLDSYADKVLSDMFLILQGGRGLEETLSALIDFASADPRMETGCLFYKMRAGKHRLGPTTWNGWKKSIVRRKPLTERSYNPVATRVNLRRRCR